MARSGRPKGSRIEYEVVEEIPASCPRCHSTDLKVLPRQPIVRPYSGPMDYDRVIWRMKRCACGQHLSVRTYEKESRKLIKDEKPRLESTGNSAP